MELKFYSKDGKSSQSKKIEGFTAFEGDKGLDALTQVLVAYQANVRQGNACTKNYAEVRGSGRKIYRQKGTGRARHSSKQSPIHVGGAVVFGPKPRSYNQKINAKVKRLAFQRALFNLASEGNIDLIEAFEVSEPKTREINSVLEQIQPKGKVLLVDQSFTDNLLLAVRNLERAFVMNASSVNAWDLVRYDRVIITEEGLQLLLNRGRQQEKGQN